MRTEGKNDRDNTGGGQGKHAAARAGCLAVTMFAAMLTGCAQTAEVRGEAVFAEDAGDADAMAESGRTAADDIAAYSKAAQDDTPYTGTAQQTQDDTAMAQIEQGSGTEPETAAVQPEEEQTTEAEEPPAGWELTLATEDWGLSFGDAGTQPRGNASAEDLAWYDAYYVGADTEKVIYLTFDCGYENGNTEPILDALQKHGAQATFFVVGHFLETAPKLARRMTAEGHAVGNHTYHHLDMPTISDAETFRQELDDVAALFHEITGQELAHYYRPPQGKCNADNLKMAHELGYRTIFWSLAYVDWNQDDQPSHEEALEKLTTRVHPGAVVLLHNTSSTNGEILDELLTRWEEMGYTFAPLSELTEK